MSAITGDQAEENYEFGLGDVFTEPPRPPSPQPSTTTYMRVLLDTLLDGPETSTLGAVDENTWSKIEIRLVGSHPLWAHHLWNAARAFATFLDRNSSLYEGKTVLELGAGGGLPGLVTVLNGAKKTVLTDYPDKDLMDNLSHNVEQNVPPGLLPNVEVLGYIWGTPVDQLKSAVPTEFRSEDGKGGCYELIILSDLIFNHSQHEALLQTCSRCLRPAPSHTSLTSCSEQDVSSVPSVLVFYSHHRPHLAHRDDEFFERARQGGWVCEKIAEVRFDPMFPDDPGDEEVRATVHGWRLTRS